MPDFIESIFLPKRPLEMVSIPNTLSKSLQGKYFIGQTESLTFSNTTNAWGALVNPNNSGVNLFANVYTISNFSDKPFLVQLWFNTDPPGIGAPSTKVSPANTALIPHPVPKVDVQFNQNVTGVPVGGINVFDRIVSPGATLVSEEDGKLIFPSGGNLVLFLTSPGSVPMTFSAIVAFGWWEEKGKHCK
ncbi:DUF6143 family protein [Desulfosporosinus hippei]|uniref:Uncharacterized protein n=1 Tax=Desulfosporosinus hippei DSM 8344 TaxID=1121419 RepID=A0A1G8HQK4_9FIRM|nr:DUF6143 family protein [Desulfosporosinus hippei]SDI08963.1 hypothetical protein SAMN05443529_12633 [Desulfosporosinus hippei DSM 8344]